MSPRVDVDSGRRSRDPDPDRHFERKRMKRAERRRSEDTWSCGWSLGPRLRAVTAGVGPEIATRDRIKHYRARHYGWKGNAVNAWNKVAHRDRFATDPSRMDFVTDFPGAALRASYFGLLWNTLALLFVSRYAIGRTWRGVTRVVDGAEWLVCSAIGAVGWAAGGARRCWTATFGRVIGDD